MKRLTTDNLATLDTRLDHELQTDRGVSYQETVKRLAPKIQQLRSDGVSLTRILELLHESGFAISASTLRTYLHRASDANARARRPRSSARRSPTSSGMATEPHAPERPVASPRLASSKPKPPSSTTSVGGREEVNGAPAKAGHFTVTPDSESI